MDYRELVERALETITEISPHDLERAFERYLLLDVREPVERRAGAIMPSILLSRGVLERDATELAPDRDTPIVVYCAVGQRSALAAAALEALGYRDVASLEGGFVRWKREGRRWTEPAEPTLDEQVRYDRHIRLDGVGMEGQMRLLDSRAVVVGLGGLGSPAALYLAAAGVGTIGLVDDERVELSNLQRQVLHDVESVGRPKVDSARVALTALNPGIKVVTHPGRLDAENATDVLGQYDLIVDASDNFPTRYLINDASLHLRVPVVHGSALRFEGTVSVFDPYRGPCYRCLFPKPPPPELSPACGEAGIFGAVTGVIGATQAAEALKLLLGTGSPLTGRLEVYDALAASWTSLRIERDPSCTACSDEENPPPIVNYGPTCTA
jgi:molybdopterin/thiamine biosynthesis adenylyltransferase/rhodanese-related sulfurtransferase